MRALCFTGGSEQWHDLLGAARALTDTLNRAGIATDLSQDFGVLAGPRGAAADAVVAYTCEKPWSPADLVALEQHLRQGKGAVFLHTANVITPGQEAYAAVVGSRFLGHPPFGRFTVKVAPGHPITDGVSDFAIDDELYLTDWVGEPGDVLATAEHEGTPRPIVYTRSHGGGRICYIAPGHDGRAWHHPAFQRLLIQATRWAAHGA